MPETIYDARWEELLPEALKQDPKILALVKAISEQKRKIAGEIWRARLWPDFLGIPEKMMEVLRYDLDVSTYEFQGAAEDKQRMLQAARSIHRSAGTISSVKDAIATVYPNGNAGVQEWWEYNGEPYRFKAVIDVTGAAVTKEMLDLALARINQAKNVRSWIDRMELATHGSQRGALYTGGVIRRRRDADLIPLDGSVGEIPFPTDEGDNPLADETGMILIEE